MTFSVTEDVLVIHCPRCGHPLTVEPSACPGCGSFDQTVQATSALMRLEVPGVTIVNDFTDPATGDRTIRRQTAAGGSSENRLSPDRLRASVTRPVEVGRSGELRALDALGAAMVAAGRSAVPVAGADDRRGEDALMQVDDQRYAVQMVTVPTAPDFWQDVQTQASATTDVSLAHAVGWVREAICQKASKVPPAQRPGTILALDVTHFGALSAPAIVRAYCDA